MTAVPEIALSGALHVEGRRVLLRVDINSPIDGDTGAIVDTTRIDRSLATIADLADRGARLVVIAHQGDSLDYHNLVSLEPHARVLEEKLGRPVCFVDDVAGPTARARIDALANGEILLLENLRILGEELSTFERDVKLTPEQMARTYLVRHLAPLFDLYVNDAFAAAHRNAPSMTAFQRLLPSAAGTLLAAELEALGSIVESPIRPALFLLGGLKVSDGFSMMGRVLAEGLADRVVTTGVLGEIFLIADGCRLGDTTEAFLAERDLLRYGDTAADLLHDHRDRFVLPIDVAYDDGGERCEVDVDSLPVDGLVLDIGAKTIARAEVEIGSAGSILVNGPAGAYEQPGFEEGTRRVWEALAAAPGRTVIGGGDTIASAGRFIDPATIDFISTGGGALIRFVSGQPLPLLEAFRHTRE